MANSSSSSGQLVHHLTDRALTPIISSANTPSSNPSNRSSQPQPEALSSLTSISITAFEAASRLGLGVPQRIMIETLPGPIVLHSFLNSQPPANRPQLQQIECTNERGIVEQARDGLRALSVTTDNDSTVDGREGQGPSINGVLNGESGEDDNTDLAAEEEDTEEALQKPPMLVVSVIASSPAELRDARRTAARLERTGREIQRGWVREHDVPQETPSQDDDG